MTDTYSQSTTTGKSTSVSESSSITKSRSTSKAKRCSNIIDKKQIKFIIGIDFGHGETSAAMCPMQWETPVGQLENAKDLEMSGSKKVIPSAITILDNGDAYIGDAAFNPGVLKQATVRVCFKQAPKDVNGDAEKIMIRFMHEIYKRIRENNKANLTDTNHLVYIATPSGWDKPTQDLYMEMARIAELPIAGCTKESRAAFVRAQHDVTSGLGRNIDKGSIVFDMGSSTLDFTYMNKNLPGLVDYGYDCGASFIEKSIYNRKKEDSELIKRFEQKYPKLVDSLVFEARNIKERVYFDPQSLVTSTKNIEDIIDDEELEEIEKGKIKFHYQPNELNDFLSEIGYIRSIENAMTDYKENHIANQDIYGVFLTGGASRMDFIIRLVCKCWGVEPSQVYRDQDPSLTISQGVAEVARMDLRTDGMDVGLEEEINQLINSTAAYDIFVETFGKDLYEKLMEDIANTIIGWRDSNNDLSINSMKSRISSAVKNGVSDFSPRATSYIDDAIQLSSKEVRKKVESIISVYSAQGMEVSVPNNISLGQINLQNVNMNSVLEEISEKLKEDSDGWGAAIGGAAIGGAVAMLLGGPLAWLIGGGAMIAKWLFSEEKTEAQKQAEAMRKNLSADQRIEVCNSISEKWDDLCTSVENSIRKALNGDASIRKSILQVSSAYMQAYKDSLKSARILVD